ncbi:tyrosine-type recombinase/integrase [Dietzia alimentaria]|uniref:tyrosine-type recombinase/integrase n=1 Tax=Dietzia alimentaria TaxID=665550 RepID=UPI00029A73A6|nr:tyrosine-type recombinase/integrase [Dietzia alimentaria]
MTLRAGNTGTTLRAVGDDVSMPITHLDDYELWQSARRLAATTISERRRVLAQFNRETSVQPAHAQPIDITRWIASHDGWSDSTIANYCGYLSAWFKWLQAQDLRADNPMAKVGTPRAPQRLPRPVSRRDVRKLLSAPTRMSTHAMILLAALQGLRVHEIAKLRAEDIDLDRAVLYVKGKGKKPAELPLHLLVAEWSRRMPDKGWWFPSRHYPSEHVQAKSVSRTISDQMRRAGVKGTPHALRHSFATQLLADGADIYTVRDLLRHQNVATTAIYAELPNEVRRAAIDRLDPWQTAPGINRAA